MFLDIKEIGRKTRIVDEQIELGPRGQSDDDEVELLEAHVRGSAAHGERGIDFAARLTSRVRLWCVRCLEPFEVCLDSEFSLVIVADAVEFGSGDTELIAEAAKLFYATDGKADMGEIAREQIYLNLPVKPLCRPACEGLCSGCGANRNRIECGCQSGVSDLRLAPLLDLKKKLGQSSS